MLYDINSGDVMKNKKTSFISKIFLLLFFVLICFFVSFLFFKNKHDNNAAYSLTEEEALIIGNELFERVGSIYLHRGGSVEKKVDHNGNIQLVFYRKNADGSIIVSDSNNYSGKNDDVPYVRLIVDDILEILSKKLFNEFCKEFNIFKYNDSYYKVDGDRGSVFGYIGTELKFLSASKNKLLFNAVSSYYLNSDDVIKEVPISDAEIESRTNIFELIYEDNSWKVNKFTMPY